MRSAAIFYAVLAASTLEAADPRLSVIVPPGGQRGSEVNLTFAGRNLNDVEEILCYSPGFHFADVRSDKDNRVRAKLRIDPEVSLGEHCFRVRTRTGISELQTFWVGALPTLEEKEPNNEFDAPQPIDPNVTIHGVVQSEDVDYFVVEAKKGERLSVEIEGMRLGNTLFDPYIAVLDAKRFELATSDDSPLLKQDGMLSLLAPEDGRYVIQVRESAYGGNGSSRYRLHVGNFPRPTAVYPAGGPAGQTVEVRLLGDPHGEVTRRIELPVHPRNDFVLTHRDDHGLTPSPLPFRVSDFPNILEVEPNQQLDQATPAPAIPAAFNGILAKKGDLDRFRFSAKKGQKLEVHCLARSIGSPMDPVLDVLNAEGKRLAGNDDSNGLDSYFRLTIPADGEYIVQVRDHLRQGGPGYVYRVEFAPIEPSVVLSMPKIGRRTSQVRQTIPVPRGSRYATMINVQRKNLGGAFNLEFLRLPDGLRVTAPTVASNQNSVPVLFEADAEADLAGKLVEVKARPIDGKNTVPSHFALPVQLVVGNPGNSVYRETIVDRAAVAVTDQAPFTIEIIEPKVPLVRNGSMKLQVRVRRQEGFKGAVRLRMLYNPQGVSSASSVNIPADKNDAEYPMNSSSKAPLGKFPIVVLGNANVNGGDLYVASQMVDLVIAEPFVAMQLERLAVTQGEAATLVAKISHQHPFEGKARVRLLGLPAKVTTQEFEFTKDTEELRFPIRTEAKSPEGRHKNVFCQVFIPQAGAQIVHRNVGSTELRIDKPPPMADQQPKKVAKKKPEPPAAKPLSRLEQLRKQQREREQEKTGGKQ